MNMKFLLKNIVFSVICALACLLVCACGGAPEASAHISIRALDAFTERPISGARVVIAETEETVYTDETGRTRPIRVPVLPDAQYEALLESGKGRITVIAYSAGYLPYVISYLRVTPGETREDITVYMFKDDGSIPVFSIIEGPDMDWAAELARKYEQAAD